LTIVITAIIELVYERQLKECIRLLTHMPDKCKFIAFRVCI